MTGKYLHQLILIISIISYFSLPFWFPDLTAVQAVVVINEIFPKPVPDETDEWIELYNTGPDAISLGNWRLENTSGTKKTYTMAASAQIPVGGIITLYQSQTGLNLYSEGDTVNLFNPENSLVDSQSYTSTLGYNNSIGRSTDGSGNWTICHEYTQNHLNENYCPLPTATPVAPTPMPTNPPTPHSSFTPFPTQLTTIMQNPTTEQTLIPPSPPQIPNKNLNQSSFTPSDPTPDKNHLLGTVTITIGVTLGLIALIGGLVNWHRYRRI